MKFLLRTTSGGFRASDQNQHFSVKLILINHQINFNKRMKVPFLLTYHFLMHQQFQPIDSK